MDIKLSLLGWLLNITFILIGATAITRKRLLWAAVFCCGIAILAVRGWSAGHMPMRNLFESFLWFAMLFPLCTALEWHFTRVDTLRLDAALALVFFFPVVFVFKETLSPLPPALQSPFFVPHVFAYMAGYALMARAAFLSWRSDLHLADRSAVIGFFCITVGLALGSWWGNEAWGGYWQWDPKEMWSLATWLIYVGYFHIRLKPRATIWARVLLWLGLLFIILTVTWINLSKLFPGMHNYA